MVRLLWEFCARYASERFGRDWHLSSDQSLLVHAGNTVIPSQVVLYSPKGTNNTVKLLFGTSLYDLKQAEMPAKDDVVDQDGLRLYAPRPPCSRSPRASTSGTPSKRR